MTKQEFEIMAGKPVTNENYRIIKEVYQYHPSIDEVRGKEQITSLYCEYGMRIIKDMNDTAIKAHQIEDEIQGIKAQIDDLTAEYKRLKEAAT